MLFAGTLLVVLITLSYSSTQNELSRKLRTNSLLGEVGGEPFHGMFIADSLVSRRLDVADRPKGKLTNRVGAEDVKVKGEGEIRTATGGLIYTLMVTLTVVAFLSNGAFLIYVFWLSK